MRAPKRLLVIDDSPTIADLLRTLGEDLGWEVCSGWGDAAADLARVWSPDVITLDLLMPGLDGWAMRQLLATDPHTSDIPVIVLTGVPIEGADVERLDAYAVLEKPVDIELLARVITAAMSLEED